MADRADKQISGAEIRHKEAAATPIAVAFACDENYAPYLPVAVQSLAEHASAAARYDIIILDCCSEARSEAFLEAINVLRGILAERGNFTLKLVKVRAALANNAFLRKNEQALKRYGYGTYARILIPDLLSDYEKVLYLDIDHIILADVAKLFDLPLADNLIAAVPEIRAARARLMPRGARKRLIEKKLGLKDNEYYIIGSPMLFNIGLCLAAGFTERVLEFLSKEHDLPFPDQDAINSVCKGRIYYLPQKWGRVNNSDFAEICGAIERKAPPRVAKAILGDWRAELYRPAIIHYVSAPKPWKSVDPEYSGIWWHYAAKLPSGAVLLFALLFPFAAPRCGRAVSVAAYKILGLPLWAVKTLPRRKEYFLCNIPVMTRRDGKENSYIYIFGLKILSIRKKLVWERK